MAARSTGSSAFVALLLLNFFAAVVALSQEPHLHRHDNRQSTTSRRDVLLIGIASSSILTSTPCPSSAASPTSSESIDLAAFNAARTSVGGGSASVARSTRGSSRTDNSDPSPLLSIRGGRGGKSTLSIPRVGHSLYKTKPEEVARCIRLALRCGIRYFDTATGYGSLDEARVAFEKYLTGSSSSKRREYADEKPELLQLLDDANLAAQAHAIQTMGYDRSTSPNIDGSAGRRGRREELFISHKLSNNEQSTDIITVKRHVKDAIAMLGVGYLDMISIHSPLTDPERRIVTYRALLELRDAGFVKSIGVCNYGLGPLEEIRKLIGVDVLGNVKVSDLPAINQLELSPFNTHRDVVQFCDKYGIAVGCAAWSKLSGVDGPSDQWAVLSEVAKARGMTKAQLLVRWSLQKGFVCVPRSGSSTKIERLAIAENSYGGVNPQPHQIEIDSDMSPSFVLTNEHMKLLDDLDVGYKAGKLGRRDGWDDIDVLGPNWDPTDYA